MRETKKVTNQVRSEEPCPFCGCHIWYLYHMQDNGELEKEYVYDNSMYPPLIDSDYDQYESMIGAVDECAICGATIGL